MRPIDHAPADTRTLRRFSVQLGAILLGVLALLTWRGTMSALVAAVLAGSVALFVAAGLVRPTWVRPVHGGSVALSEWMGKYVGGVGLVIFFFLVLTPLGLVLRCFGHDPLSLRPKAGATSHWQPARQPGPLNRMF
jgi:hypothetical protein